MGVSGQRHAPAALYPRGKDPRYPGGWVGPRAGLDIEDGGKILYPCRGSNPDRPVVQPVVRHYTAWANPAYLLLSVLSNKNKPRSKYVVVKCMKTGECDFVQIVSSWARCIQSTHPNDFFLQSIYIFYSHLRRSNKGFLTFRLKNPHARYMHRPSHTP
jgi:hypothetical protein